MSDSPVGVVGDDAVAETLRDAGVTVEQGTTEAPPSTDRVVAVGESAVSAVARADGDPLVVPIDAGRGVRSVPRDAVTAAVSSLGDGDVERHPVVEVTVGDRLAARAVRDVTLVTADAAKISEYTVATGCDGVDQFRADGVTVATAAGSVRYARRVGGPVLAPTDLGVVAPIAPFATDPDHWVLPLDSLSATIERDEATVALFADGDRQGVIGSGESAVLARVGTLRTAVVGASRSRYS